MANGRFSNFWALSHLTHFYLYISRANTDKFYQETKEHLFPIKLSLIDYKLTDKCIVSESDEAYGVFILKVTTKFTKYVRQDMNKSAKVDAWNAFVSARKR